MTGSEWFWTVAGALFALWVFKCIYMRYYGATGKHHTYWIDFDCTPHGTVWFRQGDWWTQPRLNRACPREFDRRSNPLDHELEFETFTVPVQTGKRVHEVEY